MARAKRPMRSGLYAPQWVRAPLIRMTTGRVHPASTPFRKPIRRMTMTSEYQEGGVEIDENKVKVEKLRLPRVAQRFIVSFGSNVR